MFHRFVRIRSLLIAAGLCACTTLPSHAQRASTPELPDECKAATTENLAQLQARQTKLEGDIAKVGKDLERLSTVRKLLANRSLRKNQEELLDILFRIDCLDGGTRGAPAERMGQERAHQRRAPSAASGPTPAPPPAVRGAAPAAKAAPNDVIEITTYYATNRKASGSAEPVKVYGSGVDGNFHYGRTVVTIPPTHRPGSVEMPSIWRLELEPDIRKHFTLKSVTPLSGDAARKEMADRLGEARSKSLLIFVHGYNTDFANAVMRTAQMAYDLKFTGLPFSYSWPSAASVRSYWQDEEAARLSEGAFELLIEELSQLPVTDIYIVAHSMGSRVVAHALQSRADKGKKLNHLRELLLAAPDINVDLFRNVIAPKLAAMQGTRTTLYASSSDWALRASNVVHGFRRVGETVGGVFTFPGLDTIDASGAPAVSRGYGHFYLVDSPSVLKDFQAIIQSKASAKLRGLNEVGASPNSYWRLP